MAKIAQEQLMELEKADAPINEQLERAGQFAGIEWLDFLQTAIPTPDTEVQQFGNFYGREEWVLRWLLKKLQSADARQSPQAWRLLRCLIERIPLPNSARLLNERKLLFLLRQAVEETVARQTKAVDSVKGPDAKETLTVSSKKSKSSVSKKRRRSGELVSDAVSETETYDIAEAVYEALDCVVRLTRPAKEDESHERGEAFAAEYMKSVIKTTPEESAKLLGSWLDVCRSTENRGDESLRSSWLTPFVEIWKSRTDSADDGILFAKYCLQPLLNLFSSANVLPQWRSQLEQLLSRSIILPAKNAYSGSKETDVLASFVSDAVAAKPDFASILFDNAIRSLQPGNTHRSRGQDATWLQSVFRVLKDAMPTEPWKAKNQAINKMLEMCLEHKISINLDILKSITSQCGFHGDETDADIIATIVKLDGHVFTIPDAEQDLLKQLFSRITVLSTKPEWPTLADTYVEKILVPLMGDFAKARDLTGFIHHWYEQLVEFDALIDGNSQKEDGMLHMGAWEDDALHAKLKEIMETSLTVEQIKAILDWIQEKEGNNGPVMVMADAVTGALSREETVAAAQLHLWVPAWTMARQSTGTRYMHRLWRVLRHTVDVATPSTFKVIYDTALMNGPEYLKQMKTFKNRFGPEIIYVTVFRCMASVYTCALASGFDDVVKELTPILDQQFQSNVMFHGIKWFGLDGNSTSEETNGRTALKLQSPDLLCTYVKTVLVDYPKAIEVYAARSEGKPEALHEVMWLASTTTPYSSEHSPNAWVRAHHDVLPGFWRTMLNNDDVLNNEALIGTIIDILIQDGTHQHNPIQKWASCNGFAIECLNSLPIEVFSKSNRERVLKAWPPAAPEPSLHDTRTLAYRMSTLDTAVISLKMKMMERPTLYEGFTHLDLVSLAQAISELSPEPKGPLDAFAEYARRTLGHIGATMGQAKSDIFVKDVVDSLHLRRTEDSSKSTIACGMIQLAEVVVSWLSTNEERVEKVEGISKQSILKTKSVFKEEFISNLRRLLERPAKLKKENDERSMSLYSTIRALENPAFEIEAGSLSHLYDSAVTCAREVEESDPSLASQIKTLFIAHAPIASEVPQSKLLDEDVTTSMGRSSIKKKILVQTKNMDERKKHEMLSELLPGSAENLDKLLAVRYVIEACEDKSPGAEDDEGSLSDVYIILTNHLTHTTDLRHFYLLTELLSSMLRTKYRSLTQHAIECTLASIPTILSPSSPLPSPATGPVYIHLTTVLTSLLSAHRLKLSGRAPLLNLTLLSLLRPLFPPLSPTNPSASSPPLTATHAAAFARLLTTLADPAPAAVARSSATPLVSATAKAKRLAGSHLPVVVAAYVKLSLEPGRRMDGAVREEVKRGLWAVFEAMGPEGRKVLGEEMDRSGRDVLRLLVGEWVRFGRWKGN